MNLEERANKHVDLQYPMGVEREYPIEDYKAGYKQCIEDIKELIRSNPKCTNQQITGYLNSL